MKKQHESSMTKNGDEINLHIVPDNDEEYRNIVSWRELCGYFSVSFYFEKEEDAKKFFEAAKNVVDYEPS